jgi:hypothetical protein
MIIFFEYKRWRGGPFFSKIYIATIVNPDGTEDSEETCLDYISPLGEVLADFRIEDKYEYTLQERKLAREAVLAGKNFVLHLRLKRP